MRCSALIRCGNCLQKSRFGIHLTRSQEIVPATMIRYGAEVCDTFVCAECECTGAYLVSVDCPATSAGEGRAVQ